VPQPAHAKDAGSSCKVMRILRLPFGHTEGAVSLRSSSQARRISVSDLSPSAQREGRCKQLRRLSPECACPRKVQSATSFRHRSGTSEKRQFNAAQNQRNVHPAFNRSDETRTRQFRSVRFKIETRCMADVRCASIGGVVHRSWPSSRTACCARQLSPFEARENRVPRMSSDGLWPRNSHVRATAGLRHLPPSGTLTVTLCVVSSVR